MGETLLRRDAVIERLGVKRTTFAKMMTLGQFPRGLIVTGKIRAWPESAVTDFIQRRTDAANTQGD